MLGNQNVASRRLVLSAKQIYFFHQKRKQDDKDIRDELMEEKEDNKVYVLGYN